MSSIISGIAPAAFKNKTTVAPIRLGSSSAMTMPLITDDEDVLLMSARTAAAIFFSAAALLLATWHCYWQRTAWALSSRLVDTALFHFWFRRRVPELAAYLKAQRGEVATAHVLPYGRLVFISRR